MSSYKGLALLVASAPCLVASTLYVPDPYPDLQSAVDAATSGDEIVISCGEYGPWGDVTLDAGLTIRSETGDPECVRLTSVRLRGITSGAPLVIEGITWDGGWYALHLDDGEGTTIRNCRFTHLSRTAVRSSGTSDLIIEDSAFVDNIAGNGDTAAISAGLLRLVSCELIGNGSTYGFLGAVGAARIEAEDCHFEGNSSYYGLAIGGETAAFDRCRFVDYATAAAFALGSHAVFRDCLFQSFGGVSWGTEEVVMQRCTVADRDWVDFFEGANVVRLEQTIFAGCSGTLTVAPVVSVDCSIFWNDNLALGSAAAAIAGGDNFFVDPLFCDPANGDYGVDAASPALPANNECGVLIGALGQGCGPIRVERKSWAGIKALYR